MISPAADPDSGFEADYFTEFGYYPYDQAASTCDAILSPFSADHKIFKLFIMSQ